MTIRCNRLGNIFVKHNFLQIVILYAFGAAFAAIWMVTEGAAWLKSWWVLLLIASIPTIASIAFLSCYPKEFTLENQKLIWIENLRIKSRGRTMYKTVITVGDLHAIEFLQTPIERLFNIGRIRFLGDIRSMEAREPVDRPIIPFYYGGICKFDQFHAQLRAQLPERSFQ